MQCPQRPEDGVICPGAGGTGGYEPFDLDAGKRRALWESSKCSHPPSSPLLRGGHTGLVDRRFEKAQTGPQTIEEGV